MGFLQTDDTGTIDAEERTGRPNGHSQFNFEILFDHQGLLIACSFPRLFTLECALEDLKSTWALRPFDQTWLGNSSGFCPLTDQFKQLARTLPLYHGCKLGVDEAMDRVQFGALSLKTLQNFSYVLWMHLSRAPHDLLWQSLTEFI